MTKKHLFGGAVKLLLCYSMWLLEVGTKNFQYVGVKSFALFKCFKIFIKTNSTKTVKIFTELGIHDNYGDNLTQCSGQTMVRCYITAKIYVDLFIIYFFTKALIRCRVFALLLLAKFNKILRARNLDFSVRIYKKSLKS